ncbi:glycosyltransferase family 2 protein [Sedimentibacter sp.]|uniref:glycosyltransferase family 2 protein n=1 Tax=Sedimentibacter sp. TaxID=1960295 RepID=UPI0028A0921A|nr:glycosyltransferase family 2 protein [Sedimentibacter sp.]
MKDKVLLFIPMYNCEKQIVRVLGQLKGEIINYISQVLIVNNRSTDKGEDAVVSCIDSGHSSLPIALVRNDENYGLGGSHKVAFQYAIEHDFDYVIVLHGDDQGNIEDFLPLLKSGEYEKHDCCLGARFMKGSKLPGYSKFRTFGNVVYNLMFSVATGRNIKDLGAGLNLYKIKMLKPLFFIQYPDNLTFNCYMLLANAYFKFDIKFIPISWREDDQVSNVKLFSQAMTTIKIAVDYFFSRKQKFMTEDFRTKKIKAYTYTVIKEADHV